MLRTATLVLLLASSLSSSTAQTRLTAPSRGYLFAPDQRYAVLDLAAGRVVSTGKIAEIGAVTHAYVGPSGQTVFVHAANPADPNPLDPKERIAILTQIRGADGPLLGFARWLKSPTASSRLIWTKLLTRNLMLASWQDDGVQTSLYDLTFNPTRTIDDFHVTPTTCLSSDGQTIYSVVNNSQREIKSVNLKSLAVKASSYASIGNATAYYKAPVGSDGCIVAFIERMSRATTGAAPATVYLHDVETNRTLQKLNVEGAGRFALVAKHSLLLLDLTTLVPNKLPDGTTVGLRRVSAGSLFLYDTVAGNEIARISVPADGALAGVSRDGAKAYYLSRSLLTVIDLANRRVTSKIALPFPYGIFAAGE